MKTPYRYLTGIAAGIAAGFLLTPSEEVLNAFSIAAEFSLQAGRYFALPLIFFSLPVAVTKLRRQGKLGSLLGRASLYSVIATAVLAFLGVALAWAIKPERIPAIVGSAPEITAPELGNLARRLMPANGFHVFTEDAAFLLPLIVPAFILGWHFHHDREIAEPAFNVFDSLSRILYRAVSFFQLLMPLFLTAFTAYAVLQSRSEVDFVRFLPVLGILGGCALILIPGIFPLAYWLGSGRKSPWKAVMGLLGAFLGAAASGAPLFNYTSLVRHLHENLKIPRHTAALISPVYLMFSRGGTALVSAFCMITVIRSYSSLEITLYQAAWTTLFSFLASFALPAHPFRGTTVSLLILGGLYGRGLNDGWLILVPALPILSMLSALMDTAVGSLLIILTNRKSGLENEELSPNLEF